MLFLNGMVTPGDAKRLNVGDRVWVGHAHIKDRLWRWSSDNDTPHTVYRQMPGEHAPEKLEPGADYGRIDVTAESITIEGRGYRARAEHAGSESAGNMSVGHVVDVTDTEGAS